MVIQNATLPITVSQDTKLNAHCHYCHITEQRHSYALCLHKLALRKNGRLKEDWSDCSASIGKKTCPAIDMREREVEKGYALYFTERFVAIAGFVEAAKELFIKPVTSRKPVKAKPVSNELLNLEEIDDTGYEAVISTPAPIPTKPGESLLEMAKRMLQKA
jgi:hypothetical protein